MKTFTIDEAHGLLPLVESLLTRAAEAHHAAEAVDRELEELGRRIMLAGGMRIDGARVAARRSERDDQQKIARETLAEIEAIGVQVKDIETGLIDFPCRLDDEIVLLCWRRGESAIEHWHTLEAGFRGRQPIDDRFRRRTSIFRPN